MNFDTKRYEHCVGMNSKRAQCAKTNGAGRHISHKKSWLGGWYGLLSHTDPRDAGYGKNKPRPAAPKKGKNNIWKW